MERFLPFRSTFMLLDTRHIDTDQIIPARFLTQTHKEGLGKSLFFDWRYAADGKTPTQHDLNSKAGKGIKILVAGENFGCGSSREHAVWALYDYGFRVVLSPSIGDIFKSNALKNGLLPIEVSDDFYQTLRARPDAEIYINLEKRRVEIIGGPILPFEIDPFARICLLEGMDQLGYLVMQNPKVVAYEKGKIDE